MTGQQRAAQESHLFSDTYIATCLWSQCRGRERQDYSYSSSSSKSFASSWNASDGTGKHYVMVKDQ